MFQKLLIQLKVLKNRSKKSELPLLMNLSKLKLILMKSKEDYQLRLFLLLVMMMNQSIFSLRLKKKEETDSDQKRTLESFLWSEIKLLLLSNKMLKLHGPNNSKDKLKNNVILSALLNAGLQNTVKYQNLKLLNNALFQSVEEGAQNLTSIATPNLLALLQSRLMLFHLSFIRSKKKTIEFLKNQSMNHLNTPHAIMIAVPKFFLPNNLALN